MTAVAVSMSTNISRSILILYGMVRVCGGIVNNPFTELAQNDVEDITLIGKARNGDRLALEALVSRHQAWIYNIAVRMVFQPHDAEEVTQEVLVKVITNLGTFNGESKFRTWLYRIVSNHVLNMKRRGAETQSLSFSQYGAALDGTPDLELPDPKSVPVDVPLLIEEAKIGCTTGMLLCLDRRQRLVFTLGEIFGASDAVGAEIMEMSVDNFRQCLTRARRDLYSFMNDKCGLVNANNPCRCAKKTKGFIEAGHVDPQHLLFVPRHVEQVKQAAAETFRQIDETVQNQYADIYRSHPFLQPTDQVHWLSALLNKREIREALHLK